jgi:hypothetical protein
MKIKSIKVAGWPMSGPGWLIMKKLVISCSLRGVTASQFVLVGGSSAMRFAQQENCTFLPVTPSVQLLRRLLLLPVQVFEETQRQLDEEFALHTAAATVHQATPTTAAAAPAGV